MSASHRLAVEPAMVAAMLAMPAATLAALTARTAEVCQGEPSDVAEYATLIAAAAWEGLAGVHAAEGDRLTHAARRARALSRRAVALAAAADRLTLTEGDVLAGMAEDAGEAGMFSTLAHSDTSPADRIARTMPRDLTDTTVALADSPALAAAVEAWRRHAAGCDYCDSTSAGRRPTLAGIAPHEAGEDTGSRSARAHRDAVAAALADMSAAGLDRRAVAAAMGGAPLAGRPVRTRAGHAGVTPTTDTHPAAVVARRRPVVEVWQTVTEGAPVVESRRVLAMGSIPADRQRATLARRDAAWARGEARRQGEAAEVARMHAANLAAHGLASAWTEGPVPPPAAMPALPADHGRYLAEVEVTRRPVEVTRHAVEVEPAAMVTRPGPSVLTVTTRDGATTVRPLSAVEAGAVAAPNGGRVVEVEPRQGEDTGATAPHMSPQSMGAYVAPLANGGAPRSRPRKGARGGQTGPTTDRWSDGGARGVVTR